MEVIKKLDYGEKDRYVFFISCPICKDKYNYEVNILVSCPRNLNVIKISCPYKHIFTISIKKVINNNKLLVEIQEN